MRSQPRWPAHLIPNRRGNGEVNINPNEIHQFKRTHAKTAQFSHGGIDVIQRHDALAQQPQRLEVVSPGHTVDYEARRIFGPNYSLAPTGYPLGGLGGKRWI